MPSRDPVTLRARDLDHLARRYRELSVDFGRSMQSALNEVATSSTKRMKTVLQKDRAEVARIASELKVTADRLAQTGVDVTTMRELLQRLEVKLATLDGVLDGMRGRRRK